MATKRKQIVLTKELQKKAEEVKVEPVKVEAPKVELPKVEPQEKITLHFQRAIEVYINNKAYIGREVVVPNYKIAAEVVRIAKQAFGNDII